MNKKLWLNKIGVLGILFSILVISCNKDVDDPVPNERPAYPKGASIASILNDPNYSLLKAAVTRAATSKDSPKISTLLNDSKLSFTLFAPDNAAFLGSGVNANVINALPPADLHKILSYHIVPNAVPASVLAKAPFPNLQYPSLLNPAPALSSILRLTTFLSANSNGAWINNIPITKPDNVFANGIVHKVARIIMPPSKNLWETIDTDPQLTYLKAAIQRADSGQVAAATLQAALQNIGLNVTVFAPTDDAFKTFLTGAIAQYLIAQGFPAPTAAAQASGLVASTGTTLLSNPGAIPGLGSVLASVINPTLVKGIVAYHVLSAQSGTFAPPGVRVFSVNIPTTPTPVKTFLNSVVNAHPGVTVSATFAGPVVISAKVKGAANPTASNVIISAPPVMTHDMHHTNGVIHKIDQVLLPQ
jgi:uncharacterized surface protein with fasciclin (FAS1) repeats